MPNLNFKPLSVSFDSLELKESSYVMDQEAIDALSSIGELSESDAKGLRTVFETAVNSKVRELTEQVASKYEGKLVELSEEIKTNLTSQVSDYLQVVVEEWVETNRVEIEESIQNEKNAQIVEQIVGILKAGYVEIPEERKDLLKELSEEVAKLRTDLEESNDKNVSLSLRMNGMKCEKIFNELSEGLADTEKEKFKTLIEDLEINDVEVFEEKAGVIRKSFFTKPNAKTEASAEVVEEKIVPAKNDGPSGLSSIERTARILGGQKR